MTSLVGWDISATLPATRCEALRTKITDLCDNGHGHDSRCLGRRQSLFRATTVVGLGLRRDVVGLSGLIKRDDGCADGLWIRGCDAAELRAQRLVRAPIAG